MNKSKFIKETKGMMNSIREVEGICIANVGWFNKPWLIVERDKNFAEVSERLYIPIYQFRTGDDLWRVVFKNKNITL